MQDQISQIIKKCITVDGRFSPTRIRCLSEEEIDLVNSQTSQLNSIFPEIKFIHRLKFLRFQPDSVFCSCGNPLSFSPNKDQIFRASCGDQKCAKTDNVIKIAKEKFKKTLQNKKLRPIIRFTKEEHLEFILQRLNDNVKPNYITSLDNDISRDIKNVSKQNQMKTTQYCFHLLKLDGEMNIPDCPSCKREKLSFISFEKGYRKLGEKCGRLSGSSNRKNNNIIKIENRVLVEYPELSIIKSTGINSGPWEFECNTCKTTFQKWFNNGKMENKIRCPKCFPTTKSSLEYELIEKIQLVYPGEIVHGYMIPDSKKSVDIFFPEKSFAIEINGLYWHCDHKHRHQEKFQLCKQQGITLFQFTDLDLEEKEPIILSMIKNKLGLSSKIFARKTKIIEIDSSSYRNFCNENHIKGYCATRLRLGAFLGDELVSVFSVSESRFSKSDSHEIIRFCSKKDTTIVGLFSKFIKHLFYNYQEITELHSFVDLSIGNGESYRKTGFVKVGDSAPNYFYWDQKKKILYSRINFQKHKLKKLFPEIYDEDLTEKEIMEKAGYRRYYDCGNEKFSINRETLT